MFYETKTYVHVDTNKRYIHFAHLDKDKNNNKFL